ncbi:MAG: zinc ribbon domain-containing protein [Hominimerdicola sp.]
MNTIKFCLKCGNGIGPEEKFCGACGASVAEMEQELNTSNATTGAANAQTNQASFQQGNNIPAQNQFQQNNIPNQGNHVPGGYVPNMNAQAAVKKPNPIIEKIKAKPALVAIPAAALVAVIILIIVLTTTLKYQKINAEDIFTVTFEGLDGYGTVNVKLDYEKIDALELSKADTVYEESVMKLALYSTTANGDYRITAEADKKENLKNGDKVTITVTYNEDYLKKQNIKLKNTEFDVEVSELAKGEEIDFFKGLEVTFEGTDGYGYPEVNTSGAYDFVYFDYDYDNDLSNGDKFTVTASCYENIKKAGDAYWFKKGDKYYICSGEKATKDYTVEGLKELEAIDAFENITLETKNATPFLSITGVNKDKASDIVKNYISFTVDTEKLYDIGDKVTVTATANYGFDKQGYKLKSETKEFTIGDDFPAYVTSSNASEAVNALNEKISLAIDKFKTNNVDRKTLSNVTLEAKIKKFESVTLVKSYLGFTKEKEPAINFWGNLDVSAVNRLNQIYKVTVKNTDDNTETFYILVTVDNILKNSEGYSYSDDISIIAFKSESDAETEIHKDSTLTYSTISDKAETTKKDDSSTAETSAATTTKKSETTTSKKAETTTKKADSSSKDATETTTMVP